MEDMVLAYALHTEELPINSKSVAGKACYTTHESIWKELCSFYFNSDFGFDSDSDDLGEEQIKTADMETLKAKAEDDIREEDHVSKNKGSLCRIAIDLG